MATGSGSLDFGKEIGDLTSKTEKLALDPAPGYVAFILNTEFIKNSTRLGADRPKTETRGIDEEKRYFKNVFVDKLGLEWINETKFENLTTTEWDHGASGGSARCPSHNQCLRCNILSRNYSSSRCFVLVVSTHGSEEQEQKLFMSDDESLLMSEITDVLRDKQLVDVTKILILQACRSGSSQSQADSGIAPKSANDPGATVLVQGAGAENKTTAATSNDSETSTDPTKKFTSSSKEEARQELPMLTLQEPTSDFLIVCSSTQGRVSFSNESRGSWLLNCMNEAMEKMSTPTNPKLNFMNVLTKCNTHMCEKETIIAKKDSEGNIIREKGQIVIDEDAKFKCTMCISHRLRKLPVFDLEYAARKRGQPKTAPDLFTS